MDLTSGLAVNYQDIFEKALAEYISTHHNRTWYFCLTGSLANSEVDKARFIAVAMAAAFLAGFEAN